MPTVDRRYQPCGPVLVRASTDPGSPGLPHVSSASASVQQGLTWLAEQWSRPQVREAITMASPSLAAGVRQLFASGGVPSARQVRRVELALSSYLVRWQRRATPFGLFAAVTTAAIGPAAGTIGALHTATARPDADWLADVVIRLEGDHRLRRTLMVIADSGAVVRDGRLIVAGRPRPGARTPGPVSECSTRFTRGVQMAVAVAVHPIGVDDLVTQLASRLPHVALGRIEAMVHGLIDGGFLITNLRPPMTAVDPLAHLLAAVRPADDEIGPDIATIIGQLGAIHTQLTQHDEASDPREQADIRAAVTDAMNGVQAAEQPLAVDVRLDAQIRVPPRVLDEAAHAADVLLRLTTQPFGSATWLDYHTRFRDRYGPGALVAVRDLVADNGLGYPHGYLGAPRARPAWRALTERDAYLLALIQQAMLDGESEIRLSDADIDALTIGDPTAVEAPPRIEVGIAVDAVSCAALDRGDFQLRIIGAPRAHTSMAGRFAYLLQPAEQQQLAHTFAARAHDGEIVAAQLSFPPRRVHNENVVRVGRLTASVVSLSEHPDSNTISIDDLAVTADADQLYLVQRSTGRRVIAHIPHALDTVAQTPPLARFIAEVADARSAVFGPFDLGAAARTLPYTPRIRYRRTVLAPARWLLAADDIALPAGPAAATPAVTDPGGDDVWDKAVHRWRQRWRVPARVIVCHGDLRLPLDLDHPADRALLRHRLSRADRLEVREDGLADAHQWLGRPAELLVAMTLTTARPRRLPVTAAPGETLRLGASPIVHARLVGNPARFDELLVTHLPRLADSLTDLGLRRWWIRRHRDMIRLDADQHLSIVLQLHDTADYAAVATRLAAFAADLHDRGLPAEYALASYHQHPARYGHSRALDAAEQVFATDTAAAIAQLRLTDRTGVCAQALAAASLVHLAAGFAPDPASGYRALLACLKQHTQPADRYLCDLTRSLADPTGQFRNLCALAGGDTVAASWQARHAALQSYYAHLLPQRDPAGVLRTVLHEHHVRALGVDPEFERKTNHLARTAAMRCLATADTR